MTSKAHTIQVKVRFNKPVTMVQAKREFGDCIYGEQYVGGWSEAETMKIGAIKAVKS